MYQLILGTQRYSSWSLRPWLLMRQFNIPFQEVVITLRSPSTAAEIAAHSPSGKVPALQDGTLTVWDSLAIIEYIADRHRDFAIWPSDKDARAVARAISAEMHSGFQALRQNCPMDFRTRGLAPADRPAIAADVARIVAIWTSCREQVITRSAGPAGPFLFGDFSAADAMYAPVVSRFLSYDLAPGDAPHVTAHMEAVASLPAWHEWATHARKTV